MADAIRHPLLSEHGAEVEAALRAHLERASSNGLPLYRMMQYQLGWADQDGTERPATPPLRTLGCLSIEAARITGDAYHAPQVAAAIELFVNAVGVHEEMQTGESGADGYPAVWWVWGPAQAINVGDGLHALARLAIMHLVEQGVPIATTLGCLDALDSIALSYYEGQYVELAYQERVDITVQQYSRMVRSKRGALVGGACALGGRIAGVQDDRVSSLRDLGEVIGEAAQIGADIREIWNANAAPAGRILNKSKLYPVVDVLEHGTLAQKRAVGGLYFKRVMEAQDVGQLREMLEGTGAKERAEAKVNELAKQANIIVHRLVTEPIVQRRWAAIIDELAKSS